MNIKTDVEFANNLRDFDILATVRDIALPFPS